MELKDILELALEEIKKSEDLNTLNELRIKYISKRGLVSQAMRKMRDLPDEEKPEFGKMVNQVKSKIETVLKSKQDELNEIKLMLDMKQEAIDVTLPGNDYNYGVQNPLIMIQRQIEKIFREMGYSIVEGDEVELDSIILSVRIYQRSPCKRDARYFLY